MSRATQVVPLINGALLHLQEDGKLVASLTLNNVQDARIIERTWVDSLPRAIPHPQLDIDVERTCPGSWGVGKVEADNKCRLCRQRWIEHP